MDTQEIKKYIGQAIRLTWLDRKGEATTKDVFLFNVGFVPLYGPCLVCDEGEIRCDRVTAWEALELTRAA